MRSVFIKRYRQHEKLNYEIATRDGLPSITRRITGETKYINSLVGGPRLLEGTVP